MSGLHQPGMGAPPLGCLLIVKDSELVDDGLDPIGLVLPCPCEEG
jgi:hypothetical protein